MWYYADTIGAHGTILVPTIPVNKVKAGIQRNSIQLYQTA